MSYRAITGIRYLFVMMTVAVVCALACETANHNQQSDDHAAVVDSVASADSVVLCYETHGSGDRTLVFVHGWGSDRTVWDKQVEEFEDDYRIVTIDLAGHGQSAGDRDDWTVQAFGADVASVCTDLNLNDIILVGHSMGGAINLEAARLLPGKVTALVGADTYHELDRSFPEDQIELFLATMKADFVNGTNTFARSMFPESADSALVEHVAAMLSSVDSGMGLSALRHVLSYNAAPIMGEVRAPIRCINDDTYPTNTESGERLASSFEVRTMHNVGHFVHMVDPEGFNRHLREVIEEFWPAEGGSTAL